MAQIHCFQKNIIITANTSFYHFILNDLTELSLIECVNPHSCIGVKDEVILEPILKKNKVESNDDVEDEAVAELSNPQILTSTLSGKGNYFALATSSKICEIYELKNWKNVYRSFKLPKAPSALLFDKEERHLLIADRAGYVLRFSLNDIKSNIETSGFMETLFGHYSIVLDMSLTTDGRFLLSADRDEHLRVSRYPQCFIIEKFFLGHTSYIKTIETISDMVFSAGGDGKINAWKLGSDGCIGSINLVNKLRRIQLAPYKDFENTVRLAVVFEQSNLIKIVHFNKCSLFKEICELKFPSNVVDITFVDADSFLATTWEGITYGNVNDSNTRAIHLRGMEENSIKELFKNLLLVCGEHISLDKKVGFDNMQEYEKRKKIRLQRNKVEQN